MDKEKLKYFNNTLYNCRVKPNKELINKVKFLKNKYFIIGDSFAYTNGYVCIFFKEKLPNTKSILGHSFYSKIRKEYRNRFATNTISKKLTPKDLSTLEKASNHVLDVISIRYANKHIYVRASTLHWLLKFLDSNELYITGSLESIFIKGNELAFIYPLTRSEETIKKLKHNGFII